MLKVDEKKISVGFPLTWASWLYSTLNNRLFKNINTAYNADYSG